MTKPNFQPGKTRVAETNENEDKEIVIKSLNLREGSPVLVDPFDEPVEQLRKLDGITPGMKRKMSRMITKAATQVKPAATSSALYT